MCVPVAKVHDGVVHAVETVQHPHCSNGVATTQIIAVDFGLQRGFIPEAKSAHKFVSHSDAAKHQICSYKG